MSAEIFASACGGLEILSCRAGKGARPTPLMFVHGAYAGAWQWADTYLPWFAEQGWDAHAMSLSGHGESRGHTQLDALSLENYVDDLREVVASLPLRPVLIGHSMGGMVLQKFLELEDAPAVVLMCAVPPSGLLSATLGLMMSSPHLLVDLNRMIGGGLPHLETLREALFHQPISSARLHALFMKFQPESMRAVWDMTLFNLPNLPRMNRPPMLVIGAEHDRIIPAAQVEQTAEAYGLEPHIFPAMGHAMMLEPNWQGPARLIATWLADQGL